MNKVNEQEFYYSVLPSPLLYGERQFGTAYAPVGWDNYCIWRGEPVSKDIQIPAFELRDGSMDDYLDNDCSFNLCSKRLMQIVEENKSADDIIEWYPVEIKKEDLTSEIYYILHLPVIVDVLDWEKTIYHGTTSRRIISPCFRWELIKKHSVFGFQNTIAWIVNEKIKNAIEMINCTGISFRKVKVTQE